MCQVAGAEGAAYDDVALEGQNHQRRYGANTLMRKQIYVFVSLEKCVFINIQLMLKHNFRNTSGLQLG